jgi:hypothetical protein
MLSLKLKCHVPENRLLTVRLPEGVLPGEHELFVVIDQPEAQTTRKRRQPGSAKGKLIILAEDDEHLQDFQDYLL